MQNNLPILSALKGEISSVKLQAKIYFDKSQAQLPLHMVNKSRQLTPPEALEVHVINSKIPKGYGYVSYQKY